MSRARAALTDKEERILIQAQLMGLSTGSMIKIGNRLRALEKEREDIAWIDGVTSGFDWSEKQTAEVLTVVTPDGYVVKASRGKRGQSRWDHFSWSFNIVVSKPGTRFKPRVFKNKELRCEYDWKKRLMPDNSKELFSLIRWIKNSMPHAVPDEK
jgi:hypothetical protein